MINPLTPEMHAHHASLSNAEKMNPGVFAGVAWAHGIKDFSHAMQLFKFYDLNQDGILDRFEMESAPPLRHTARY